MARSFYVNGEWVDEEHARISVLDRGFLFSDAVYEVAAVIGGKLIDYPAHTARLSRSLKELGIAEPMSADDLLALHREAIKRNDVDEGLVYLQVTRGAADRDFVISDDCKPGVVIFTQSRTVQTSAKFEKGLSVKSVPDLRWGRRDIKTVQLLYSSMMKTQAAREGFDDVLLVENGKVNEASSANFHIVRSDGVIVTPPLSHSLLPGITRASVLGVARDNGLAVEEGEIAVAALKDAQEAFITSATAFVMPVTAIDGKPVGEGKPGQVTRRMRELYIAASLKSAI